MLTLRKSCSHSHLHAQMFAFTTQMLNCSFPRQVCKHRESICQHASRHALRRGIRYQHKCSFSEQHPVTPVTPRPDMAFWNHRPLSQ